MRAVAVIFAVSVVSLIPSSVLHATPAPKHKPIPAELGKKVVEHYVDTARAMYADALSGVKNLRVKIDAFVAAPTEESFKSVKLAWQASRDAYGPTEALRFYGGPIDDPEKGPEGLMNAWPLDEAYLDYVKGKDDAGIINRPKEFPEITKSLLVSLHEKDGEKNISTGFHAIEFLLWGQDFSLNGPGDRKFTDYTTAKNADRRKKTLRLLGELLEDHLSAVVRAWEPSNPSNYGERLKKEPLEESLRKIYTGIVNLSIDEMAGERMTVSLEKNDQENEQDCFSDYTLKGMVANELGVHAIYFGVYGGKSGPGVHALAEAIDPVQAKKTKAQLEAALRALKSIPGTFDQAIAQKPSGAARKAAMKAVTALEDQAHAIAKSGLAMGLVLNIQ